MGTVIRLQSYRESDSFAEPFNNEGSQQEINSVQQLLAAVESVQGECDLMINLSH